MIPVWRMSWGLWLEHTYVNTFLFIILQVWKLPYHMKHFFRCLIRYWLGCCLPEEESFTAMDCLNLMFLKGKNWVFMTSPDCPLAAGWSVGAFRDLSTLFNAVCRDRFLISPVWLMSEGALFWHGSSWTSWIVDLYKITTVYPCTNVQGCYEGSGGKFSRKKFMYSLHTSPEVYITWKPQSG